MEERRRTDKELHEKIDSIADAVKTLDGYFMGVGCNGDTKPGIFERQRITEVKIKTIIWAGGVLYLAVVADIVRGWVQ